MGGAGQRGRGWKETGASLSRSLCLQPGNTCESEAHVHTHARKDDGTGSFCVSAVKTNCSAIGVVPLATSAFGEAAGPLTHPPPGHPSPVAASLSRSSPPNRPWLGKQLAQLNTTLDSDHHPPNINSLHHQDFSPSAAEPCSHSRCFSTAYQSRTPFSSPSQLALIA